MTAPAVIVTPAYSHVHPDIHKLVLQSGLPWLPLYGHSDLPRVRSVLLEEALKTGAERVILLDADTVPESLSTLGRLATTRDCTPTQAVFGLYPMREGDRWAVCPEDTPTGRVSKGSLFRLRTAGLGCCVIHRESLERAGAMLVTITEDTGTRWRPFCVPFIEDGTYYADDGSLCLRLRKSDTELWCDPAIRAGHAVTTLIKDLNDGQR